MPGGLSCRLRTVHIASSQPVKYDDPKDTKKEEI